MNEASKITATRPQLMARHALTCRSCRGNVALITNSPNHLTKLEAMASIDWCTFRKAHRRAHS
jgi:hypothetical protein